MAKTSMVNRDIKRKKLVKKYAAKRAELKKIISSTTASYEEKMEAVDQAAEAAARFVRRPASRNRCELTGRSRGVYTQVRPRPQQAARSHHARRRAGPAQGQLVTAGPEASDRDHADIGAPNSLEGNINEHD